LASHTDPQVRAAAIEALAPIGSPDVVALLQKSLHDASPIVVRAAAKALDRYKTCPPIDPDAPEPALPSNGIAQQV
jgi:HEAT repeat protein